MILQWYFGFHPRPPIRMLLTGEVSLTSGLGHVEAWCNTIDDTWLFFDPQGRGTLIDITHIYEEVVERIEDRMQRCAEVYRIEPREDAISYPVLRPHLHCITQCSALLGWRAYTMQGFRSMLLKNGAEIIHAAQERPRGREGSPPPAEHRGA